jgi:D-glycero-D-manno-heptose 1,7-bisphosphate phosphatase
MCLAKKKFNFYSKKLNNLSVKKNYIVLSNENKYINSGVSLLKKKILCNLKNEKDFENEVLLKYIKKKKVIGKKFSNNLYEIGSYNNIIKFKNYIKKIKNRKSIFLDRDGVINYDYGYVSNLKKFKFRRGVISGLKLLIKKNFNIFIVTNQAGIAKNKFSLKNFIKLSKSIKEILSFNNIFINKLEFCPHHPNGAKNNVFKKNCNCRKPKIGMINNILKFNYVNKNKSIFIGDKKKDYLCAKRSGIRFLYAENNFFKQVKKI